MDDAVARPCARYHHHHHHRTRSLALAALPLLLLLLLSLTTSSISRAADPPDDSHAAAAEKAREVFNEGSAHYQAKRWSAALVAFERSYALSSSPNTGLLIGRCLRELGRMRAAALIFERTEEEARRRVAAGETKYAQAAEAATREGRALRSSLSTIRVHVSRFRDAKLTIDGQPVDLDDSGNATAIHDGGTATIELRYPDGEVRKQSVTIPRGATIATEFGGDGPTSSSSSPPPASSQESPARNSTNLHPVPPTKDAEPSSSSTWPPWTTPTIIGSGVVALAGLGVYIGFNAAARSTYDTLATRCGPSNCGASERALADEGRDQQSIAIAGLVVGAVAAAVAGVVIVFAATRPSHSSHDTR